MSIKRILVALDVPTLSEALGLVEQLKGKVGGFKVGLELCNSEGTNRVIETISAAGGDLFVDLKFKDIPNTVAGAVRAVAKPGVKMFNLHCDGGLEMMRTAVETARAAMAKPPLIIGVTVLTSWSEDALRSQLGIRERLEDYVVRMASLAQEAGLDGVVCSARETAAVKRTCGQQFLTVTPSIRPQWAVGNDQRRPLTPADALATGTDYMVIGRPITNPPAAIGSPVAAVERIVAELEGVA